VTVCVCVNQWDFTILSGGLLVLLIVLIIFGLLCAIIPSRVSFNLFYMTTFIFALIAVIIFPAVCNLVLSVFFSVTVYNRKMHVALAIVTFNSYYYFLNL